MKKVACVIPAYNEVDRIANVLAPVVQSGVFDKIIVVDDGSTDHTGPHVSSLGFDGFQNIEVRWLPVNKGKSFAVGRAVSLLKGSGVDYVCLLDADLIGLTTHDLVKMLTPIITEHADATLSSRSSYGGWWTPNLDIFTGERVVPLSLLESLHLESRTSFEMEALINGALISSNARIKVVPWPNVTNPTKMAKYGMWEGVKKDYRMFQEMRKVGGARMLIRQVRELRRQVV